MQIAYGAWATVRFLLLPNSFESLWFHSQIMRRAAAFPFASCLGNGRYRPKHQNVAQPFSNTRANAANLSTVSQVDIAPLYIARR